MTGIKSILFVILLSAGLIVLLSFWIGQQNSQTPGLLAENNDVLQGPLTASEQEINNPEIMNESNPHAFIKTNKGVIELELYAQNMPITVGNFVELAKSGFYNEVKFHRVIDGFMIQAGDPNTKGDNEAIYGTGGPGYTVQDEFVEGEHLSNTRGSVAMANTGQPNSGGSQWFINLVDNTPLDFNVPDANNSAHPVFGRVVSGMDVVDQIGSVEIKAGGLPTEPVIIESIEIVESI